MSPPKKLKLQQYQKNYQKNYREKNKKEQSNFNKNAVLNLWQIQFLVMLMHAFFT